MLNTNGVSDCLQLSAGRVSDCSYQRVPAPLQKMVDHWIPIAFPIPWVLSRLALVSNHRFHIPNPLYSFFHYRCSCNGLLACHLSPPLYDCRVSDCSHLSWNHWVSITTPIDCTSLNSSHWTSCFQRSPIIVEYRMNRFNSLARVPLNMVEHQILERQMNTWINQRAQPHYGVVVPPKVSPRESFARLRP